MKILPNEDPELARQIKQDVINNDGYCPCALIKDEDTKCMCLDFRTKLKDPSFEGYCHCTLYRKVND